MVKGALLQPLAAGGRGEEVSSSRQPGLLCGWDASRTAGIAVSGAAGAPWAVATLGGPALAAVSSDLPGAGMSKGTITAKEEAKVLPSFHRMEIVQVDGYAFQERAASKVYAVHADCWPRWGHLDKSGWKYEWTT